MKLQNIIVILIVKVIVITASWSPPYLVEMHENITVTYNSAVTPIQIEVVMDEEIQTPFSIAYFNGYSGSTAPSISSFVSGTNANLGMSFELDGTNWKMSLTRQQDYENVNNRQYRFFLNTIDGINSLVTVRVRNIFDVPPTIIQHTNPCEVAEYNEVGFDSGCIFEVRDADGMTNNSIAFTIANTIDEFNIFTFEEVPGSKTEFTTNFTLIVQKSLNYSDAIMYTFGVDVTDNGNNLTPINVQVKVKNVPSRLPIWIRPFESSQFREKEAQEFEVYAIDGDRGIDAKIYYKVEFYDGNDYSSLISIDQTSGIITVNPIDRDSWKREIFSFNIIAYKSTNISSSISSSAVLVVEDVNDNFPLIFFDNSKKIQIWESEFDTLFASTELSVNDIDLGANATYSVSLLPQNLAEAFSIVPTSGYQLQNFTLSVARADLIDYDRSNTWRFFNLTIKSEETQSKDNFIDEKVFQVEVLNWNDEVPEFESSEYEIEVNETVGSDYLIGSILASDMDINDTLVYFLTGRINESISINPSSGELRTIMNLTFDYERQEDVYFQAFVRDELNTRNESTHTAFTQIHIIVLDINDTPPQLILPQGVLKVEENSRSWTFNIEASDVDTKADLDFFIVWANSSVSGSDTSPEYYQDSLIIETNVGSDNRHSTGTLKVNPLFPYNIDYEKYHFMYIMIGVRDKNTEVNEDSAYAMLTIEVEDVNDNAPQFIGNTLKITRRVIENAEEGIFIGSIMAVDVDGPGNNVINYTMVPSNSSTPDGWLRIDLTTGDILVDADGEISCDKPNELYALNYTVILFDGVNNNEGIISIEIIDVNNKYPQIDDFISTVSLYENATSEDITTILAHDDDRDAPHNILLYSINTLLTSNNFFEINPLTGELRVRNLTELNVTMDRDNGITQHTIHINVVDNEGRGLVLSNSTSVTLILLDCNDNAPEMPQTLNYPKIFESLEQDNIVVTEFSAVDKDEGKNAEVDYEILSIESVEYFGEGTIPNGDDLFIISNKDDLTASIRTGKNLKGFSGTWRLNILARDRGAQSDAGFSLETNKTYEITIEPFNFEAPSVLFPRNNEVIRADLELAFIGSTLKLLNGSNLSPFEAIDNDVGEYGDVSFKIDSTNGDHEFFDIRKLNKSQSEIVVKNAVMEQSYSLSIIAIDGGNRSSGVINVMITFVNRTSDPIFESSTFTTDFTENEEGLLEQRILPSAYDPKNLDEPLYEIYYFIDPTFNPQTVQLFQLNKTSRVLKLTQTLNREEIDHYQIRVIASNFVNLPPISQVSENSMLTIDINVNDVNDNSPVFDQPKYEIGISEADNLGKILFILYAEDKDLNDRVTYHILQDTMTISNEDLESYKNNAFLLNNITGILTLNFQVQETMSGYFKFEVEARDLVNHTDRRFVTVYTISESSRFSFVFENTLEEVTSVDESILIDILSDQYQASCIRDDILPLKNEDGTANETLTVFRAHFMKGDDVLSANDIERFGVIPGFLQATQRRLRTELNLELHSVPRATIIEDEPSPILEISLAIISGVLGLLLIAGIAYHIIQMRSYNRQIKALSQSSFDPNILNAKKLPTQNLYSKEKSNPAMANADFGHMDLDTKSIISAESDDFEGLENNPIFDISSKVDEKPKNPLSQNDFDAPRKDSSTYA